jgi:sulfite reductase alpha subunit-like flavoprotein
LNIDNLLTVGTGYIRTLACSLLVGKQVRSTGDETPPKMHTDLAEHSDEDGLNPEKVLVLFASETGNAQDTAERVGREIRRRGGRCTVQSMEDFDIVCKPG